MKEFFARLIKRFEYAGIARLERELKMMGNRELELMVRENRKSMLTNKD